MTAGAEDRAKGKWDELKGKFNKRFGRASMNTDQEIRGEAQQVKGKAKQAWGKAKRAGQRRLGGSENCDDRHAKQRREMHCPGIVGQKRAAFAQLHNQFVQCCLADSIDTVFA